MLKKGLNFACAENGKGFAAEQIDYERVELSAALSFAGLSARNEGSMTKGLIAHAKKALHMFSFIHSILNRLLPSFIAFYGFIAAECRRSLHEVFSKTSVRGKNLFMFSHSRRNDV